MSLGERVDLPWASEPSFSVAAIELQCVKEEH